MCIAWTDPEWRRATKPFTAYKIVTHDNRSPVPPHGRTSQEWAEFDISSILKESDPQKFNALWEKRESLADKCGGVLEYPPGKLVRARRPGIYLYVTLADARRGLGASAILHRKIIRVTVPRGASFRRGDVHMLTRTNALCATSVINNGDV
jgi:hypothetical protein